jgi:hypothetical protein
VWLTLINIISVVPKSSKFKLVLHPKPWNCKTKYNFFTSNFHKLLIKGWLIADTNYIHWLMSWPDGPHSQTLESSVGLLSVMSPVRLGIRLSYFYIRKLSSFLLYKKDFNHTLLAIVYMHKDETKWRNWSLSKFLWATKAVNYVIEWTLLDN